MTAQADDGVQSRHNWSRAVSSKLSKSPVSMMVSKALPSVSKRNASSTWKLVATPRSAALRRAISMAGGETSTRSAMAFCRAALTPGGL